MRAMITAYMLSGGGSLPAVQVALMQALGQPGTRPDLVVPTSAGTSNRRTGQQLGHPTGNRAGRGPHRRAQRHALRVGPRVDQITVHRAARRNPAAGPRMIVTTLVCSASADPRLIPALRPQTVSGDNVRPAPPVGCAYRSAGACRDMQRGRFALPERFLPRRGHNRSGPTTCPSPSVDPQLLGQGGAT